MDTVGIETAQAMAGYGNQVSRGEGAGSARLGNTVTKLIERASKEGAVVAELPDTAGSRAENYP